MERKEDVTTQQVGGVEQHGIDGVMLSGATNVD